MSSDVFEIVDHTSASGWEKFISSIEDLLANWQLDRSLKATAPATEALSLSQNAAVNSSGNFTGAASGVKENPEGLVYEIVSFEDASYLLTLHTIEDIPEETAEERISRASCARSPESSPEVYANDETPQAIRGHLANHSDDFRKARLLSFLLLPRLPLSLSLFMSRPRMSALKDSSFHKLNILFLFLSFCLF